MRISDWSSDVCSSDLEAEKETWQNLILHQESMKPPRIGLRLRHRQEAPPRRDEPRCPPGHRPKEIETADEEHQPMRHTPEIGDTWRRCHNSPSPSRCYPYAAVRAAGPHRSMSDKRRIGNKGGR